MADSSNIDIVGCWGNSHFECASVNYVGKSDGLLRRDHVTINKSNIMSSKHYLAIFGHQNGFLGITTLVNVYGP